MLVATIGEPTALTQHIRDVFRRLDPNRAVDDVQTLAARRDQDVAPSRLNAVLFGSFAALALLIAALGVLAALAFSVSQRFREFGIRMAVGADRGTVLRSVLAEGLILLAGALVLGAGAALLLGGAMADFLFEVRPSDPVTMAVAAIVLGLVALAATLLPALRATRIDPCEALRAE
jgi:ABC-type antimicrobial peptide transport system permease subunit